MVEWELSGLLSMWEQKLRRGRPRPIDAGGVLCAGNSIATALAALTQEARPGKPGGETEIYQSSTWKLHSESATRKAW